MTEVMKKAIDLDEKLVNENEEKLNSLLVENKGLKELLSIRNKYGGTVNLTKESPERSNGLKLIDKEIQTEDLLRNSNEIIVPFQLDDCTVQNSLSSLVVVDNDKDDVVMTNEDSNAVAAADAVESCVEKIVAAENI
jgi:hypothetical protein